MTFGQLPVPLVRMASSAFELMIMSQLLAVMVPPPLNNKPGPSSVQFRERMQGGLGFC